MKPDHTTGGHRLDIKKYKRAMKKARKADIERRRKEALKQARAFSIFK